MADLSYLFGSKTPASVSGTITDTTSALPSWLQEYTRGLAGQATAVAGQEYQGYTPPTNAATYGQDTQRVAGFTPAQLQAQQQVLANQGNYQPYLDTASQTVPQAVGQYMSPYTDSVGRYYGSYVTGPDGPRFFPVPGNHDYTNPGA